MKHLLLSAGIVLTTIASAPPMHATARAMSLPTESALGCTFRTTVSNQLRSDSITVTKISTATPVGIGVPIYKKQWDGSVAIAAGHQHRFSFTVDMSCQGSHDVKVFYTRNGNDHDHVCFMFSGGTCAIN